MKTLPVLALALLCTGCKTPSPDPVPVNPDPVTPDVKPAAVVYTTSANGTPFAESTVTLGKPEDVNFYKVTLDGNSYQTVDGFGFAITQASGYNLLLMPPADRKAFLGNGAALVTSAFSVIPHIGVPVLVFGLVTFAFSTILGWYYYGERACVYLFGEKAIKVYKVLWVIAVFAGSLFELNTVWNIADILNGLMAIPNIIAVLLLSNVIAAETKKYSGVHIDDIDTEEIPTVKNAEKGILG